jgi:hypothetical protein
MVSVGHAPRRLLALLTAVAVAAAMLGTAGAAQADEHNAYTVLMTPSVITPGQSFTVTVAFTTDPAAADRASYAAVQLPAWAGTPANEPPELAITQHAGSGCDADAAYQWARFWADKGSRVLLGGYHSEVVFFHGASRTLILSDLIQNFELAKAPFWFRPLIQLAGVVDPDGKMPLDIRISFRPRKSELKDAVCRMIEWAPERVILAHGRWYERNGVAELKRAFRWLGV